MFSEDWIEVIKWSTRSLTVCRDLLERNHLQIVECCYAWWKRTTERILHLHRTTVNAHLQSGGGLKKGSPGILQSVFESGCLSRCLPYVFESFVSSPCHQAVVLLLFLPSLVSFYLVSRFWGVSLCYPTLTQYFFNLILLISLGFEIADGMVIPNMWVLDLLRWTVSMSL